MKLYLKKSQQKLPKLWLALPELKKSEKPALFIKAMPGMAKPPAMPKPKAPMVSVGGTSNTAPKGAPKMGINSHVANILDQVPNKSLKDDEEDKE